MLLRKYILLVAVISFAISCKKEEAPDNNTIAAANYFNVAYGNDPLQKLDVYLPEGRSTAATRVMILVHGGAWASGDKVDFASFIDTIKRRWPTYAIFNINYRLSASGTNVFPTQEMDTKAAVDFIYSKRAEYLIGNNITMVGASAGAHLALLHAYKSQSPVKIKAVVDFFGPTDLNDLYNNPGFVPQATIADIIGATPASDPLLYQESSPIIYATNGSACPTIILQGSADPLVNAVTQSIALRNKLTAESVPVQYVEYAGGGHGDWSTAVYSDAFSKIQAFVNLYNP